MATVYKIEIETVSAWINYSPEMLEKEIFEFLESRKKLGMENTKVKAVRK